MTYCNLCGHYHGPYEKPCPKVEALPVGTAEDAMDAAREQERDDEREWRDIMADRDS